MNKLGFKISRLLCRVGIHQYFDTSFKRDKGFLLCKFCAKHKIVI